jgi:adenylate kinase family enzyme
MSSIGERVVVIGSSGSGKTTFARQLAAKLDSKCIELDELHWGPNWTPKPQEELSRLAHEAASGDRWVIEGNYAMVREIIWPRATSVVWLNYSFPTVFYRTLKRTIRRLITQEKLWNGNRESFRMSFFSRDSILLWVLRTFHARRKEFNELRASSNYPHLKWIEFKRPSDTSTFLSQCG